MWSVEANLNWVRFLCRRGLDREAENHQLFQKWMRACIIELEWDAIHENVSSTREYNLRNFQPPTNNPFVVDQLTGRWKTLVNPALGVQRLFRTRRTGVQIVWRLDNFGQQQTGRLNSQNSWKLECWRIVCKSWNPNVIDVWIVLQNGDCSGRLQVKLESQHRSHLSTSHFLCSFFFLTQMCFPKWANNFIRLVLRAIFEMCVSLIKQMCWILLVARHQTYLLLHIGCLGLRSTILRVWATAPTRRPSAISSGWQPCAHNMVGDGPIPSVPEAGMI